MHFLLRFWKQAQSKLSMGIFRSLRLTRIMSGFSVDHSKHLSAEDYSFPTNSKILLQTRKAVKLLKIKDASFNYLYKRRHKSV